MAQSFNSNLGNIGLRYLLQLKVPVTAITFKQYIQQNPYYPSLYSLSNTFDKYNVPNEAFNVEEKHLDELQPPFITFCKNLGNGKDFVLVTKITDTTVSYLANIPKATTVTREKFLLDWEKTVLIAEPTDKSGEPNYLVNLKKEKQQKAKKTFLIIAAILIMVIAIAIFLGNVDSSVIDASWILLTKFSGVSIAVLLLVYEIDKTNSFVKNLCTAGTQTNCDAVLNSKAAGIAGIKWSEAGFFYFGATTLFLLYPAISFSAKIAWLAIVATSVSPYILFSIYYQYKVAKQWCPLCIASQAVLLLELAWSLVTYWQQSKMPLININILLIIFSCIVLPVIIWYFLQPILQQGKNARENKNAYKRVLYNPEYFDQLLQKQPQIPDGWQDIGITIGNLAAMNTIIKVCNPYCSPCAKVHPILEGIIHNNNEYKLKIIFTVTNNENDKRSKPVKHLLAIAANNTVQQTEQALDDWYSAEKKEYDTFAAKYPINDNLRLQNNEIDAMNKWCNEAEIMYTPSVFINGRRLPDEYNVNELKNIL